MGFQDAGLKGGEVMANEFIFYGGLAIAAFSLGLGAIAAVALHLGWKNLSAKLDAEFGKKRR
jgi:hypothetical protein